MATVSGRGRGRGGNMPGGGRGGGGGGGGDAGANNIRRGSWRAGPPGSAAYNNAQRGGSPAPGNASPRQSINDHMNDIKKAQEEKARSKAFATDTDISGANTGAQRELKPWSADEHSNGTSTPSSAPRVNGASSSTPQGRDTETFGTGSGNGKAWDQFETNSRLFGTKTNYQEELYTTKLNKSGPDFKKREKEAERLANEIMSQSSSNTHMLEERNMVKDWAEDEEEKYSGVVRNPNAYVPPGARKPGAVPNKTPTAPSTSSATAPKANGTGSVTSTPIISAATPSAAGSVAQPLDVPAAPAPARSTSDTASFNNTNAPAPVAALSVSPTPAVLSEAKLPNSTASPLPDGQGALTPSLPVPDAKDGRLGKVVDSFREFVGGEKEKLEAKRQSQAKSERERQLAELKRFQSTIKIPLPMPKDILPILSKDADKQKAIEASAAKALESNKAGPRKSEVPPSTASVLKSPEPAKVAVKAAPPKKVPMSIQEIPPFNPNTRRAGAGLAPMLPVPETAKDDIPLAVSPTPSQATDISAAQAKLNPKANTFVFKPNPSAAAFKPGQSSTGSPANRPGQIAGPSTPTPAATSAPLNPFFKDKAPARFAVNPKEDFNPWKHGSVPLASSIVPHWQYTGRAFHFVFMPQQGPPMSYGGSGSGFEDDPSSPHARPPHVMQGYPANMQFPPFGYRVPNMPPGQMPMHGNQGMFSPGPGYSQIPGQNMQSPGPQHMGGPQQPNGMPMYFQNSMSHNPQFIPQHMQYPNTPQRQNHGGPGPNGQGGLGPGGPMYYQNQHVQGTPHQTPQMQHSIPFPPQSQPPFASPMQLPPQLGPGGPGGPGPGPGPGAGLGQSQGSGGPA